MAGVHRSQFTENMKKDMYGYFWEKYDDTPPKHQELFEVVSSNAAYEKFTSAIGLGELLEKPEGEDLQADAPMESYTIVVKNRSFGRIVRFSYETVKDAQKTSNMLSTTVGTWGRMVPITKEKFYSRFFNNGVNDNDIFNNSITGVINDSSGEKIYDGDNWFSTSHTSRAGTDYSNYSSVNALSHTNLQTVWQTYHQTNNRDERDEIIELSADVILLPPALKFTAEVILNTTLLPGSMDNDTNVMKSILSTMEWAYLTDADGWFMGKKKQGLMATDREDVTLDFWQDETSKDFFASIFTRFGGAITNWRYWYANNIA